MCVLWLQILVLVVNVRMHHFKFSFNTLNENFLFEISLKFIPKSSIDNKTTLFQVIGGIWELAIIWINVDKVIPVKVTLDICRSPIESQWGSRKYPG